MTSYFSSLPAIAEFFPPSPRAYELISNAFRGFLVVSERVCFFPGVKKYRHLVFAAAQWLFAKYLRLQQQQRLAKQVVGGSDCAERCSPQFAAPSRRS